MNHKNLLEHCVRVLDTYNRDVDAMDEHVNKYLKYNGVSQTVLIAAKQYSFQMHCSVSLLTAC